jgi:hypothetical protein
VYATIRLQTCIIPTVRFCQPFILPNEINFSFQNLVASSEYCIHHSQCPLGAHILILIWWMMVFKHVYYTLGLVSKLDKMIFFSKNNLKKNFEIIIFSWSTMILSYAEWNYLDCNLQSLFTFSIPWLYICHKKLFHYFKYYLMMKFTLG